MRWLVSLSGLVASLGLIVSAQQAKQIDFRRMQSLREQLNPETPNWSADYIFERAAEHLATIPDEQKLKVRYFSLAEVPRANLPMAVASLLFWCPSASVSPFVMRLQPVPDSDGRLWWFDLDWFRWTPEVWENIANEDPYYRNPIVSTENPGLKYLLAATKSNAIIRGDWFVFYASDTSLFLKGEDKQADNAFYYQLLYSSNETETEVEETKTVMDKWEVPYKVTKQVRDRYGRMTTVEDYEWRVEERPRKETVKVKKKSFGVPKTLKEFQDFWEAQQNHLKRFPIDRGAVVDEGESFVSFHNRTLQRIRTKLGVYWQSYDVFRTAGDQDFVENLIAPPKRFDASEIIVQDGKGAQIYFLTDGKGNRVELADPRLVHDTVSGGNFAVITAKSCVACHVQGIIPMKNEIPLMIKQGVEIKALKPLDERIRSFYLSNLDRLVKTDQEEYSEFIRTCNGLTAEENARQFTEFRKSYDLPLTFKQAARELGSNTEEFGTALSISTKGRLGRLILDGKTIPRQTWEKGLYAESGLLLLEYRKSAKAHGFNVP